MNIIQHNLYVGSKKNDINELIHKIERLTEHKCMVTKGERGEGGMNYEFGVKTYTLLYIK